MKQSANVTTINTLVCIPLDISYIHANYFSKTNFFNDIAFGISVCMHVYFQTFSLPRILGTEVTKSSSGLFQLSLYLCPRSKFLLSASFRSALSPFDIQLCQYSLSLFYLSVDMLRLSFSFKKKTYLFPQIISPFC